MGDVVPLPRKKTTEDLFLEYVFLLGGKDQEKGLSFRENPYQEGTMERDAWHQGWWAAFFASNLPGAVHVDENV